MRDWLTSGVDVLVQPSGINVLIKPNRIIEWSVYVGDISEIPGTKPKISVMIRTYPDPAPRDVDWDIPFERLEMIGDKLYGWNFGSAAYNSDAMTISLESREEITRRVHQTVAGLLGLL